jgi:hypothetical protein
VPDCGLRRRSDHASKSKKQKRESTVGRVDQSGPQAPTLVGAAGNADGAADGAGE